MVGIAILCLALSLSPSLHSPSPSLHSHTRHCRGRHTYTADNYAIYYSVSASLHKCIHSPSLPATFAEAVCAFVTELTTASKMSPLSLSLSLFLYGTCMYVCTFVYARTYRNEQIQDIAGVVIHIRRTIMLSTSPCLPPYMTYTLPPSFPPSLPASCGSLPFAIELTSTVAEAVCVLSPSLPQQARPSLSTDPPPWVA